MSELILAAANGLDFRHIGWRYYNGIKKKAMEQEFSWSGLVLSLSIAFFIVIAASAILRFTYVSMDKSGAGERFMQRDMYQLEVFDNTAKERYLQSGTVNRVKIDSFSSLDLV
jgi:hypothetical protein